MSSSGEKSFMAVTILYSSWTSARLASSLILLHPPKHLAGTNLRVSRERRVKFFLKMFWFPPLKDHWPVFSEDVDTFSSYPLSPRKKLRTAWLASFCSRVLENCRDFFFFSCDRLSHDSRPHTPLIIRVFRLYPFFATSVLFFFLRCTSFPI